MTKTEFYTNLSNAEKKVYPLTCGMVINTLPAEFLYIVSIQSSARDGLEEGEFVFPNKPKLNQTSSPMKAEEVIELLWQDGLVPVWINMSIDNYDEQFSYITLECSGRFAKDKELLYHKGEENQPFHVLSPAIPHRACDENDNIVEKFDIRWNKR